MASHAVQPLGIPVVYLVDDETVVRDALAWLLRSRRLLSEGFGHAEAFEAYLATRDLAGGWPDAPSCLLLDVRMPGMSGLALFERLLTLPWAATMPVIFLSGHADVATAVDAVKRGAFDFCEKPFSDNALVDRVEQALQASATHVTRMANESAIALLLTQLTEREREVMQRVIAGLPNKLVADELDISVRTVEVHRARIFEKMGVKSAVELANKIRN